MAIASFSGIYKSKVCGEKADAVGKWACGRHAEGSRARHVENASGDVDGARWGELKADWACDDLLDGAYRVESGVADAAADVDDAHSAPPDQVGDRGAQVIDVNIV